jgi:hypothetical protein
VTLPLVVWRDDGHLTREAAVAAADGELADGQVLDHLDGCDLCLQALGEAAIQASRIGELLVESRRQQSLTAARPRRRLSLAAAALLTVALTGLAFAAGRVSAPSVAPTADRAPLPWLASAGRSAPDSKLHLGLDDAGGGGFDAFSLRLLGPGDCLVEGARP